MYPQTFTPSLLLDETKCRENIANMAEKARRHKLLFRPHFKSPIILYESTENQPSLLTTHKNFVLCGNLNREC